MIISTIIEFSTSSKHRNAQASEAVRLISQLRCHAAANYASTVTVTLISFHICAWCPLNYQYLCVGTVSVGIHMCSVCTDVVCLEGRVNSTSPTFNLRPSVHGHTDAGGFNIPQTWQMYRD